MQISDLQSKDSSYLGEILGREGRGGAMMQKVRNSREAAKVVLAISFNFLKHVSG